MIEVDAVFPGILHFLSRFLQAFAQSVVAEEHIRMDDLTHGQDRLLLFIRVFLHPNLNTVPFYQPET